MIKVYEDFELSKVGQVQSVLEAAGIRTHLKNQYTSSVLGEIPFVAVRPELWILEDGDLPAARRLIEETLATPECEAPEWTCRECGAAVDGVFARCWKCGQSR